MPTLPAGITQQHPLLTIRKLANFARVIRRWPGKTWIDGVVVDWQMAWRAMRDMRLDGCATFSFQHQNPRRLNLRHTQDIRPRFRLQASASAGIAVVNKIAHTESPQDGQGTPAPHACVTQGVAVLGYQQIAAG